MQATQVQLNDAASAVQGAGGTGAADTFAEPGGGLIAACIKALRSAANYGHWDLFRSLLNRSKGALHGTLVGEALVISAEAGDAKTVTDLLEGDANGSERMGDALGSAIRNGHLDVVKLLIDHEAAGTAPYLSVFDATIKRTIEAAEVNIAKFHTGQNAPSLRYWIESAGVAKRIK